MTAETKARIEQAGYVALALASWLLPKLVVLQPTWTWVPQVVTIVAVLAAAFRPDPKSAAFIAALQTQVANQEVRIHSLIAPDISRKGPNT